MESGKYGAGEDLGGVGGEEIAIRIYYMKKLSSIKNTSIKKI